MIAYRDATRRETFVGHVREIRRALRDGNGLAALVEAGELEQGVLDSLPGCSDGWSPLHARLRDLTMECARLLLANESAAGAAAHTASALRILECLESPALPAAYEVRSPEGYLHYALDPLAYAASARRYRAEAGPARAARAVVIGLRSIGTSLSAVVAVAMGAQRTLTIRPRGESGSRRVSATEPLVRLLREWLADEPDLLLVDEGPGATGETFLRAWEWLRSLGIPQHRIVLFPSYDGGFSMAPPGRKEWFQSVRRYLPSSDDPRLDRLVVSFGISRLRDLSGGRWRQHVPGGEGEAARVSFERLKYAGCDESGRGLLLRYAGAGRWGQASGQRARALAERGLAPAVVDEAEGFRLHAWAPGRPVQAADLWDGAVVAAVGDYVSARAPLFNTGRPVAREGFIRLLEENAREALMSVHVGVTEPGAEAGLRTTTRGADRAGAITTAIGAAVDRLRALPEREAVVPDARLHRREWVIGPGGVIKVDGADDGDGLRWPGPTDRAWDLAGIAIEFGLPDALIAELVDRCARAAGESGAELSAAVRAYRPIYAACALGDTTLSAREAYTPTDRLRLEAEAARYAAVLVRELGLQ